MPRNPSNPLRRAVLALAVSATLFPLHPAGAAVIDATWLGGIGNWNDPANWSTGVVPRNTASDSYNVRIDADPAVSSMVNTIGDFAINQLRIDAGDQFRGNLANVLSLDNGGDLNLTASLMNLGDATPRTINNHGTITLNRAWLRLVGDTTLVGGGTFVLTRSSDGNHGEILGTAASDADLINHDNLIRGAGRLSYNPLGPGHILRNFTNRGTVRAESQGENTRSLFISPSQNILNQGLFEAAPDAGLIVHATQFSRPQFTQSAGESRADGTIIFSGIAAHFDGGLVTGDGTIDTTPVYPNLPSTLNLAATLSPGPDSGASIGQLDIVGDLHFKPGGTYRAQLAPDSSDRIDLTGLLDLTSADDRLELTGGLPGQTYTLATYTSLSGTFDIVTPGYSLTYSPTDLRVTVLPEPALSLLFLTAPSLTRRRRTAPPPSTKRPQVPRPAQPPR